MFVDKYMLIRSSPINACVVSNVLACHDTETEDDHMENNKQRRLKQIQIMQVK